MMIIDENQDKIEFAEKGDCVRLIINIADGIRIHAGNVLHYGTVTSLTSRTLTARVLLKDLSYSSHIISRGFRCMLHLNTCTTECVILAVSDMSSKDRLIFAKSH
jgi:translation elongation factor EF-1alpha